MPYPLILFAVLELIIYLLKEEEKIPEMNRQTGIKFLVNGKNIQMSHIHHCRKLLEIDDNKVLTDYDIKHAYSHVYFVVAERRVIAPVIIDVAELRAAKFYLLDRWAYLAYKN